MMNMLLKRERAAMRKADETGDDSELVRVQRAIDRHIDAAATQEEAKHAVRAIRDNVKDASKRLEEDANLRVSLAASCEKADMDAMKRKRGANEEGEGVWERNETMRKLMKMAREEEDDEAKVDDVEDLETWDETTNEAPTTMRLAHAEFTATLTAHLKPHQMEGVEFLQNRAALGKGGLLAFVMGLGKTFTALAHIGKMVMTQGKCHVVVVCPLSVLGEWKREHARFSSCLPFALDAVRDLDGLVRVVKTWARKGGVIVMSKHTVVEAIKAATTPLDQKNSRSSVAEAGSTMLDQTKMLVVDEIHTCMKPKTHIAKTLLTFKSCVVVGLTGTPLSNSPHDFYDVSRLIAPELFDAISAAEFDKIFAKPILQAQLQSATNEEQQKGREQTAVLRTMLSDCTLHKSSAVLRDILPLKTEVMLVYDPDAELRKRLDDEIKELDNYLSVQPKVDEILRHLKTKVVCGILNQMHEDDAAVVFTRYKKTLKSILSKMGADMARIFDGDTASCKRVELLRDFDDGVFSVLLLSYGAGSVGINCQRANIVILADPAENPSEMTQAVSRSWRIGQSQPVAVYRFAAKDTVDMRILRRGAMKTSMAHSLLHTERLETHLGEKDVRGDSLDDSSITLIPPSESKDERIVALGGARLISGFCSYDAFFDDVESDATDASAARNKYNMTLNAAKKTVVTSDGEEHVVNGGTYCVKLKDGSEELIVPPYPIVRCTSKDTVLDLAFAHRNHDRVAYEVSFRKYAACDADGEDAEEWTEPRRVGARRFRKTKKPMEAAHTLVCKYRVVVQGSGDDEERTGPWSPESAPFVLRD